MRRSTYHCGLLALFLCLALALTYPLVTNITTHVPGSALWAFDEYTFVWNIWWFKHALLWLNQSPLQSDHIFYPVGVSLVLYTYTVFNAAFALPLVPWLPLPLISNLITLFAFVMSAYGAYLLARWQMAHDQWRVDTAPPQPQWVEGAAICTGVAYAFTTSKFIYAAIGHYDMVGTQWIPFFALYFLRMLRTLDQPLRVSALRDAIIAGLFMALAMYVEMIFGVFLGFFVLIYLLVVRPWRIIAWHSLLVHLVTMGAVAAVVYMPMLIPVLNEFATADYALKGWGDAYKLSVDLLGFVSPSALSSWAGLNWQQELSNVVRGQARFSDVNTVFIGYTTLALMVLGAVAYGRAVRVWVVSVVTFAVFALGPLLQIGGQAVFDLDGLKISLPLPFIILHFIPIVQANRVPNRFAAVLMLCVAVLVGYGSLFIAGKLAGIWSKQGKPWAWRTASQFLLVPLTVLWLITEHLVVPLPLTDARVPEFYTRIGNDAEDYAILQLPLGWRNSFGTLGAEDTRVQYYQTIHHKRILGGNTSRNHPYKFDYFAQLPIVSSVIALENYQTVPLEVQAFDRMYAEEFIRFFNLRYVVVHPAVPNRKPYDDTRAAALNYLLEVLPLERVHDTGELEVYRVKQTAPQPDLVVDFGEPASRAYRGEGWGEEEEITGQRANWATAQRARLFLPVSALTGHRLAFAALPFTFPHAPPQHVTVVVNGRVRLPTVTLHAGWQTYEMAVPASALQMGLNELVFEFAYARAPQEVLASADTRTLAAAVDWVRWQR